MNRRVMSLWVTIIILFSTVVILVDIAPNVSAQTTYYVDDVPGSGPSNPPEDFTSIQDAINASSTGDTVFVYNGTYYENVVVNRTINLTGESREATIINGSGVGDVVRIEADWVNVTGFNVTGSGVNSDDSGFEVNNMHNCNISFNNIIRNRKGIDLDSSWNNSINNNWFSLNNDGIDLFWYCNNNSIKENIFTHNYRCIFLNMNVFNNTISNNIAINNDIGITLTPGADNNYIINNNCSSNQWNGIVITGGSANFIISNNASDNYRGIYLSGGDNNTVTGNDAHRNELYGIFLDNSNGNSITNNNVSDNGDGIQLRNSHMNNISHNSVTNNTDGIFLWNSNSNDLFKNEISLSSEGLDLFNSSENDILDNTIFSNSNEGIQVSSSHRNIISENNIFNNSKGILCQNSNENNIISNNISKSSEDGIFLDDSNENNINGSIITSSADDGIYLGNSHYNTLTANNVFSNTDTGIFVASSNWNNLTSNRFSSNGDYGVYISDSDNNMMENNTIHSNRWGVSLTSQSEDNSLFCNNLSSNFNINLYIGDSISNIIDNNTITFASSSGIQVDSGSFNTISNNTFSNNQNGVVIGDSTGVFVADNTFSYNTRYGIYLLDSADWNTIYNNDVSNNADVGIKLWQSNNNTVKRNNISYNGFRGMSVLNCSNNRIYHNNFIYNVNQANDSTDANNWDDGYPSGGNFWSDYVGEDLFWGPYQDIPIPPIDNIGDWPYDIDSDSRDRYPLLIHSELFMPLMDDGTPLIITSISVIELTDTSVTISWWTNEVSDSKGNWSLNPDLSANTTTHVQSFTTIHSVTLTSLNPNQTYYFEVTSMDAFGNIATDNNGTQYYHFTTMTDDISPPQISDVTTSPVTPEVQGNVNITANVTDNNAVYSVVINITDSSSNPVGNFSMEQNPVDGSYYFNSTFSMLGIHTFVIWANDSAGNWVFSTGQFEMFDTTPPQIIDPLAAPTPQDVFGSVNLTAVLEDNFQVSGAWVHITDPNNETAGNFSMSYDAVSGMYYYEANYSIPGIYTYVIWVQDESANWNSTLPRTLWFQMWDVTTPGIVPQVRPSPQEYGGFVNITALITDDIGIGAVWVRITGPDDVQIDNSTMQRFGTSDFFWFNTTYSFLGGLNYTIWAFDNTGNWATATGSFKIVDTTPPIVNAGFDMDVETGTKVTFNGSSSTDNHAIDNYSWQFTYRGTTIQLFGISPSFKFEIDGYYTVQLTATDVSGNSDFDSVLVIVAGIDSDGDGLSDYEEEHVYLTDPDNPDTDGDGGSDGDEVAAGDDPLVFDITNEPKESGIDDVCWFFALLALIVVLMLFYVLWPRKERKPKKDYPESEDDWDYQEEDSDLVPVDREGRTYRVAPTKSSKTIPDEELELDSQPTPRPPTESKKAPPRPPKQ